MDVSESYLKRYLCPIPHDGGFPSIYLAFKASQRNMYKCCLTGTSSTAFSNQRYSALTDSFPSQSRFRPLSFSVTSVFQSNIATKGVSAVIAYLMTCSAM